jgi:C-terminal processing protease CtpA/Prc
VFGGDGGGGGGHALGGQNGEGLVGIGITLKRARGGGRGRGGVFVSRVKEDGAAAREGSIRRGDELLSIDGVMLSALDMPAIGNAMMGGAGSSCSIYFLPGGVGDESRRC